MQKKVHVYEYHYFSLKKFASAAGIKANVWIDSALTKRGTFRHFKSLDKWQIRILKIIKLLERRVFFPIILFLGNDLWLKSVKE
jgi:hypothetical protein